VHRGLRHSLLGDARSRLGLVFGIALVVLALAPASASAEPLCTDTWTGASEGTWQTASNWSTGSVPGSSDVACIGTGKTALVTEGTDVAGVLKDEGALVITGGSLELANALEVSSVSALTLENGTLTGTAALDVSSSFSWSKGTMSGPGSTVLKPGVSATLSTESNKFLTTRSLVNEGVLTFSKGPLWMSEGATIRNTGVFKANSESNIISSGEQSIVNTGTLEKTVGTGETTIEPDVENLGTIDAVSGHLRFTGPSVTLASSSVLEGAVTLAGAAVTGDNFLGQSSTVTLLSGSTLTIPGGDTATIGSFTLNGGTVTGVGTLDISGSFSWVKGTMSGLGSTVLASGSTESLETEGNYFLSQRTLVNEGVLTLSHGELWISEEAKLENVGTFIANSEKPLATGGGGPLIVNLGTFKKTVGAWTEEIGPKFLNLGSVLEETGAFDFIEPQEAASSEMWGGEEDPSAPGHEVAQCGESVSCTGNFSQNQTDFAIGGRGVGLDLTRTYNSQAAAKGVLGAFGYGWSSSFSDHLVVEGEGAGKKAVLYQADGSTVPFAESGGVFTAPAWSQDTLSGSKEAGYSLTLENQAVYKFAGATGRLESVTDRNGNATTLTYNGGGQLTTITDPASRTIKLAYNGEGLVESAEDPMKHVVKYTYKEKQLASVTQPAEAGLRWQFTYGGEHQLTELTDGRGGKTVNEYNGSHQLVSQTDPMKRVTTFEYGTFRTKTTNHATGAVTMDYLTSDGLAATVTRGYGTASATTESRSYDAASNLLSVTDGNGHTTKYGYDSHSNRTSMVDPEKDETKWTYDSTHDIETETKPNGEKTTYKRDTHGNPEVIERPAPGGKTQITKYKYTSHGQVESMTDPLERTWKYEYDAAGDKAAEIDPESDKRTWGYNEDSQETSMVSPRGHVSGAKESEFTTTTERDAQGRPIKVTDPLGHETKSTYDGDGNLETVTDPEAHKTTYTYDADNERTKVEEPNKTIAEIEYDGAGQVKKQIDGNKHTTEYVRNVLEQVTEVIDPLSRKTLKEYDKAGNLVSVTDAAKRTTTYKYDSANRLTEISYSDGKTPTVKYEYNSNGDRTKMVDGTGTTTYEYDQLDRLTATKDGHGNTAGYEYDLANEQTKITYPNGKVVEREYDKAGRLKNTTDWSKNIIKFTYDADADLTATTFPSGTSNEDTYKYDNTDAMTEVKMKKSSETLASLVYTRNKDELVEKATSKGLPGEEKPAYTYDKNNRLTKGVGVPYEYDAANNPTTIGTEHTYSYNAADELEKSVLKKATAATYTYNEVGERIKTEPASSPATTYVYDQAGDLTGVTRLKGSENPAIEDAYGYNGDGLRTSETISGTTTYLAWDIAEKLPLILNDGTNSYIYGPGGLPVEQINNTTSTTLYLHHDQQGSTRLLTSSTGTKEASFTYDAYGNQTGHTGTATTPLGYDGQYTNADTGLIYLRAREYDPATAQFLSVDPKVEATNAVYEYAKDDPLDSGDPTGELSEYKEIFGAQELVVDANRLRSLAANSALLAAAVADDYLSIPPAEYAKFLLQKAARFEAVANSLEHRKKNDAIGFLVREWYVALPKTNIALPLKFKEAYAWYKGTNRSGEEQFWCGKEGWVYLK
jgi:RHS repeat-associated protein